MRFAIKNEQILRSGEKSTLREISSSTFFMFYYSSLIFCFWIDCNLWFSRNYPAPHRLGGLFSSLFLRDHFWIRFSCSRHIQQSIYSFFLHEESELQVKNKQQWEPRGQNRKNLPKKNTKEKKNMCVYIYIYIYSYMHTCVYIHLSLSLYIYIYIYSVVKQ